MVASIVLLAFVPAVHGHGGIVSPPARETTVSLWFNEGCQVGCERCKGHVSSTVAILDPFIYCFKRSQEPTLDLESELVTYPNLIKSRASSKYNPWYAPGFAPVFSPCGLAAGQANGSYPQNGDVAPAGFKPGDDGRDLKQTTPTVWPIGSIQEVAWSIAANHGGGYAVRLCPIDVETTEDCFQSHHLSFHGDSSWIKLSGSEERVEIKANRTTTGTHPSGSQWTKVPIPSCGGKYGGGLGCDAGCAEPQFPSPVPGLWGNGPSNGCAGCDPNADSPYAQPVCEKEMAYEIIDKVKVPNLQPGKYVLSFRWDCEQTAQIWSQCSDIEITASDLIV
jgi:hypothetical protein